MKLLAGCALMAVLAISATAQTRESANASAVSAPQTDRTPPSAAAVKPNAPEPELRRHPLPLPPSPPPVFAQDSPPDPPIENRPLRRRSLPPDAECIKDTDFEFLGALYGPNRVQQNDSEVVAPLDRVEEIPDERVEGIPRVGED